MDSTDPEFSPLQHCFSPFVHHFSPSWDYLTCSKTAQIQHKIGFAINGKSAETLILKL